MKRKKQKVFTENYIAQLFRKSYAFTDNQRWQLPTEAFPDAPKWQLPSLQKKKRELNAVKEQLNEFELSAWSAHTKRRDPGTQIIKLIRRQFNPELLTQAWCKFYECLSYNNLIPATALNKHHLTSLHLCEAPGGFISALNHYLRIQHPRVKFSWLASTLNPDYEGNATNSMIPDDRLIAFTKPRWLFGADHTGDITKVYNCAWICSEVMRRNKEKVHLITADGSVNCMENPGDQERHVEFLHFCEAFTALSLLQTGGNFVIKIFTTFEDATVCLLYLLNCVFSEVVLLKPATSKAGNSETYVICRDFHGAPKDILPRLLQHYAAPDKDHDRSMFALGDIPVGFLEQIEACASYFMTMQIAMIQENIKWFGVDTTESDSRLHWKNCEIARRFIRKYQVYAIEQEECLVLEKMRTTMLAKFGVKSTSFTYRYYKHEQSIALHFVFGKRLDRVLFSKYMPQDLSVNIVRQECEATLYSLCSKKFANVIDCRLYAHEPQFVLQEILLKSLIETSDNCDILILNLRLDTNFLICLFYILASVYTVYFFKQGVVYLSMLSPAEKQSDLKRTLTQIQDILLNPPKSEQFQYGLLECFDVGTICSQQFINYISFYNSNLCQL